MAAFGTELMISLMQQSSSGLPTFWQVRFSILLAILRTRVWR